jgi:hypothetical protein
MQQVTVEDWMVLAEMIWSTNEANGWDVAIAADWDSNKRKLAEKIALIHSELSEAWQGSIDGDEANYLEELADVAIRILDVLEGLHPLEGMRRWFEAEVEPFNLLHRSEQIATVHLKISNALEYLRKGTLEQFSGQLIVVFRNVEDMATSSLLLYDAMVAKNEVNRNRGFRHGNKAL